jgi:DnaJ domain
VAFRPWRISRPPETLRDHIHTRGNIRVLHTYNLRSAVPVGPLKLYFSNRMSSNYRKCHYETLGVPQNASTEDIKTAFRKLSLQTHPDVAGAGACAERFKQISHAASVLTNAKNRQAYDQKVANSSPFSFHRNSQPHNRQRPHSMTSILVNMFRPRNLIVGPIALFAAVSAIQYTMGIDNRKQSVLGAKDLVQAWKNPESGNYETPAPWDPVYRRLQPELEYIPRDQVQTRNR